MKRFKLHHITYLLLTMTWLFVAACSTEKNTSQSRWWHSFNTRYNVYYNGSVAYIDGSLEKEKGNKDNYTEIIPLYTVGNKNSIELGKGNFDRAIEKSKKAIQLHSIKRKPVWNKERRKTPKDIEWLNRREYNPFLWKAWLLMGRSQFHQGAFDEASSTFSYMSRLYRTQPHIYGKARAWLAKSYIEQGWMYDAEDVIRDIQRDSLDWRAVKEWDYTYADYYIHTGEYEKAIPYLRKVIKHEMRKKQKAREWFLLGQLLTAIGNKQEAYKAFKKVIHLNPPYELEFNARIAMTEVMAASNSKKTIDKLRRMAGSDNNKEYQDQIYYAIGNIHLAQKDTLNAIIAYENGNKKSTRSGVEKGVLLLKLGDLYWSKEKFGDARRCYNDALGMLDKDRADYEQLALRSKILDELVPFTDAVHLQDSLQALAKMSESDRNKAIDRVISELKRKEKEERQAQALAEAQGMAAQNGGNMMENMPARPAPGSIGQSSTWYFYNPLVVSQGKATFERQWGKRENVDNWRRVNKTVVALQGLEKEMTQEMIDSIARVEAEQDSIKQIMDMAENDPHKREYYLAQIPFTEEQMQASNELLTEGLFNSGVIFKDKLDNLPLSEKALRRLTDQYPTYKKMDDVYYHLFLLYSRMGMHAMAQTYIDKLKAQYPESQWTILLTDPHFRENAKVGVEMEDSLYTATYEAFKADRYSEVRGNSHISETQYPKGANRDKFIFIGGLSKLNAGDTEGSLKDMKTIVEQYPQSKLSEMAGMILNGVKAGRRLRGGKFDIGNVWERRTVTLNEGDSTEVKQFSNDRNANFMFMIAYQPDSLNENQLLYELAKYNFTSYLVRNFDIDIVDTDGLRLMQVKGFRNYDEALQYARQLYRQTNIVNRIGKGRGIIISEPNYELLGKAFSYDDYDKFYAKHFAPLKVSTFRLLTEPAEIVTPEAPVNLPTTEEIDDILEDGMFIAPEGSAVPDTNNGTFVIPEDTPVKQDSSTTVVTEPAKTGTQQPVPTGNNTTVVVKEEPKSATSSSTTVVVEEPKTATSTTTTVVTEPVTDVQQDKKNGTTVNGGTIVVEEEPAKQDTQPQPKTTSPKSATEKKPANVPAQTGKKQANAPQSKAGQTKTPAQTQPQTPKKDDTGIYFNDGFGLPNGSVPPKKAQEQSDTSKKNSKTTDKNKQGTTGKTTPATTNSKATPAKEQPNPKKKSVDLEDEYYDLEGF